MIAVLRHGQLQCVQLETGTSCGETAAWLGAALADDCLIAIDPSGLYIAVARKAPQEPRLAVLEAGSGNVVSRLVCGPISSIGWTDHLLVAGNCDGAVRSWQVSSRSSYAGV